MRTYESDVLVVGSGIGGLVSAVRALEHDADVTVLEKGPRAGGTTRVTGGYLRVNENEEPKVTPYEPLDTGVDWLEGLGIRVRDPPDGWVQNMRSDPGQRAKVIDPPDFVANMVGIVEEMGGEIHYETAMVELLIGEQRKITGVTARADDEVLEYHAPSVVLATGDLSGNSELLERYTNHSAENIWLRRDPISTGDGFAAALDIGAKTTGNLSKVEGHCMVAPPAEFALEDLRDATQYYAPRAIAIDEGGNRFADESVDPRENELVERILALGIDPVYYVIDQNLYDAVFPHEHAGTRIENAKRFGGRVVEADSLSEFAEQLGEAGVDGERAVRTIEQFNEAVRAGDGRRLDPPRTDLQYPIDTPPFYAVKVRPGVTFLFGGLDVDHQARVIERASSSSTVPQSIRDFDMALTRPIEGLYAAGVEVGRPRDRWYYEAGLSLGLATGRIAGKHAAEHAISTGETQARR